MEKHILTVDVEDNFTPEELAYPTDWDNYEGQVIENTSKILHMLKRFKAGATFFVVGKVAQRHPEIIEAIISEKHEVSSHSYHHRPLGTMSKHQIEEDIRKSQELLSGISGRPVLGFRAMGFSIPEDEEWFYQVLKRYGYKYDSSKKLWPGEEPKTILTENDFYKVYPSTFSVLGREIIFSGGTYFRLMPMFLINKGIKAYNHNTEPVMIYVHPWEFNKDQPKRRVPLKQALLQSPCTFSTEKKLSLLLPRNRFVSVKEYLGI